MARKKFITQNEKILLTNIANGLFVISSAFIPNIGVVNKLFPHEKPRHRYRIKQTLNKLINDRIILLGGEKIILSKRGEELLKLIQIEELLLKNKPQKWDGVWHLIAYDVPNFKNNERDYFRRKLKSWGFEIIQKSLWLYPYECREEVAILAQSLGISPFVIIMNSRHIPNENKYLKLFNLAGDFKPE